MLVSWESDFLSHINPLQSLNLKSLNRRVNISIVLTTGFLKLQALLRWKMSLGVFICSGQMFIIVMGVVKICTFSPSKPNLSVDSEMSYGTRTYSGGKCTHLLPFFRCCCWVTAMSNKIVIYCHRWCLTRYRNNAEKVFHSGWVYCSFNSFSCAIVHLYFSTSALTYMHNLLIFS